MDHDVVEGLGEMQVGNGEPCEIQTVFLIVLCGINYSPETRDCLLLGRHNNALVPGRVC